MATTPHNADTNLLFGVLALQMEFITRDQLIAGMQAWVNEKATPLAEHLVRAGALRAAHRQGLEPLVAMHIQQHGGDPERSLASISSAIAVKRDLHCIPDADLQHSIQRLPSHKLPREFEATLTLGASSSNGTRFHILRPHARGGLGEVFVARDTELGREVALKEIQLDKDDAESRARFTREAEITGGLEHPGIVPVYGLGSYPDGRPFYAMRFIRGKSLQDAIRAYHADQPDSLQPEARARDAAGTKSPPQLAKSPVPSLARRAGSKSATEKNLELRRLLQRFIDVCEAIDYAHSRGVLHRDLKPGNIMLGRYGETLVVDWGLAKSLGEATASSSSPTPSVASTIDFDPAALGETPLVPSSHGSSEQTMLGSALGTPAYMSPEQAQGRIDLLGPMSDVFSLGATLYHLLTGRPPYAGKDAFEQARKGEYTRPRYLLRDVPLPLEAICVKALALPIGARYATAKQLADDVERYLADEPVQALPESLAVRAGRWSRRNRHWMQAGTVALVLVAAAALGAYFYQRETAAQNLKLADDKGKLAEEKGKLADEKSALAKEAQAKAASLRQALAQNYFAHGISEYAAQRQVGGILDLQRAWAMTPADHPLKQSYQRVLLDRITSGGRAMFLQSRQEGSCSVAVFSPQGDRVLTGGSGYDTQTRSSFGVAKLWDAVTGLPLGKPMRQEDDIRDVAFDAHGKRFTTVSSGGVVQLWDSQTHLPLTEPLGNPVGVSVAALSPQGDCVLSSSDDNQTRLWRVQAGRPFGEPLVFEGGPTATPFSPLGDRVLTFSGGAVLFWDANTGASLGKTQPSESGFTAAAFSPQGNHIFTCNYDTVQLWDVQTGAPVGEPMLHPGEVAAVRFRPQGDRVATLCAGVVRLWDAKTGRPQGEPLAWPGEKQWNPIDIVAFSPVGDRLAVTSEDAVQVYDAENGRPLDEPFEEGYQVHAMAFSPEGDRLLTFPFDGDKVRIRDISPGKPLGGAIRVSDSSMAGAGMGAAVVGPVLPSNGNDEVRSVAFSPQGDRVVTGSLNGFARLLDIATGEPLTAPLRHEKSGAIEVVAFSPQGDRVLTVAPNSTNTSARLWNATTGAPLGEPIRHSTPGRTGVNEWILVAVFSPQGDRVLTGGGDGTARLWDARTGAPLGQPMRHKSSVIAVCFHPHEDRVLTGSWDKTAQLWDGKTGAALNEPLQHDDRVQSVAFSPQGDRVLTSSEDGTARLWDATTGAALRAPIQPKYGVKGAAFSSNGSRILTTSAYDAARVWNAQTGEQVGEPLWNNATSAAFSPQGDRVVTIGNVTLLRFWDAETGAAVGTPLPIGPRTAVAFRPQGDFVVTDCADSVAMLWDVRPPAVPADVVLYVESLTGQRFDQEGSPQKLTAAEQQACTDRLARDSSWIAQVRALRREREILYHDAQLHRKLHKELDFLAAEFHLARLHELKAESELHWKNKLAALKQELANFKRVRWKDSNGELRRDSETVWLATAPISDEPEIRYVERDRRPEYVELFDENSGTALRLYPNQLLIKLREATTFEFSAKGAWVE